MVTYLRPWATSSLSVIVLPLVTVGAHVPKAFVEVAFGHPPPGCAVHGDVVDPPAAVASEPIPEHLFDRPVRGDDALEHRRDPRPQKRVRQNDHSLLPAR